MCESPASMTHENLNKSKNAFAVMEVPAEVSGLRILVTIDSQQAVNRTSHHPGSAWSPRIPVSVANGVQLMRRPAHSDSEFFLVCQLSVICARPHYVRSWLVELCRRDGFAVFHLNGGGIKGDRRRPPPEKPIDTESLQSLSTLNSVPTASANCRDVDRYLRL